MKPLSRLAVPAEFDEYADGYDAGMGNPIKRLVGSSPVDFLRVKIRWLLADIGTMPPGHHQSNCSITAVGRASSWPNSRAPA